MKKFLFYAMQGKKMCFMHVLMNAVALHEQGYDVKIVFEGESVKLPPEFEQDQHKLYLKAKDSGLIAGVCYACSAQMGVLEEVAQLNLPLLRDMNGHAGMLPFVADGYDVIYA